MRFDAFAPGGAPPTVTAQLLNQQGTKMTDVPVTAPPATGQPYSIDLPLASLAAGQYLLEITGNSEGHKPVTELVAFDWQLTISSRNGQLPVPEDSCYWNLRIWNLTLTTRTSRACFVTVATRLIATM